MLNRNTLIITAGIVTAATLCGCGNGASENMEKAAQSVKENTATETSEKEPEQLEESDTDIGVEEENSETLVKSLPEDGEAAMVYGNGSYFVKAGDRVFCHDYEMAYAKEPSQGGNFLYLGSGIDIYDEGNGEISVLTNEPCSGKLFLCGDDLYSTCEEPDGIKRIVRVSMDGEVFRVGPGEVIGISDDGKLVALWCNDASGEHLDVLNDQRLQYCRVDAPADGNISFVGLTDKELIYQVLDGGEIKLFSLGEDNKEVCLGTLSDKGVYGSLECDDFLFDEDKGDIYGVFAHYDGPVDSVEDYLVVSANPGKEDSLELVSHGYNYDLMPNLTYGDEPTLRLNNGKPDFGFFDEEKLYLSHSYLESHMLSRFVYGNLLWCNESGEVQTIIKSFIPYMDRDNFVMQTGQVLGDEAYVLVAGVKRNEDSDYKLSQAFDFEKMYVLRVPLSGDSVAEVISGGDFEGSKTFDYEGFDPYVGNWRMDDFIVENGVTPSHSRNMWIGITDEQELSFMDNEEYSGYSFMLSTSAAGDECLVVGYSEGLELTCTGKLVNEGGQDKLILEVQERLSSIDDPGPASWKGSFHRVTDEEWNAEWGTDH